MTKSINDIDVLYMDQMKIRGQPISNLLKYKSNEYIPHVRYSVGNKFDLVAFNRDFDKFNEKQIKHYKDVENQKLAQINAYYDYNNKPICKNNFLIIIIKKWLTELSNIASDLTYTKYDFNGFIKIFTKNNRLYYIGITFIIISLIYYILSIITNFFTNNNSNTSTNTTANTPTNTPTNTTMTADTIANKVVSAKEIINQVPFSIKSTKKVVGIN